MNRSKYPAEAEYRRLMCWEAPWKARVWDFLTKGLDLKKTFTLLENEMVHGTPTDGLYAMLNEGFQPRPHGILAGSWLCVSPNVEMLRYFGETKNKYNGFYAEMCKLDNLLRIEELHLHFLEAINEDCGDLQATTEQWTKAKDDPANERLIRWMIRQELLNYDGQINPIYENSGSEIWKRFPAHIHGLIWPAAHKNLCQGAYLPDYERSEAELSLTAAGAKIFEESVTSVFVEGQEAPIQQFRTQLLAA